MAGRWKGRVNAEVYDRFVRDDHIYRRLNTRLAELARVRGARRVLDMACGTGATAVACLRLLDFDAELVGVDASEEMVEVARANVLDPRARFKVAPAAAVDRLLDAPFDRAVCNAAFWQFPAPGPVLGALARLLAPGALFVFNVPAERVPGEPVPVHPFQVALARALEARAGSPLPVATAAMDPVALVERMSEAGFELERRERFVYEGKQGELMRLMGIPSMLAPLAPDLSPEQRESALEEARSRTQAEEPVTVPWVYFIARRRK